MSEKLHKHTNACYSRIPETEGDGEYLNCGQVAGFPEAAPPQPSAPWPNPETPRTLVEDHGPRIDTTRFNPKFTPAPSARQRGDYHEAHCSLDADHDGNCIPLTKPPAASAEPSGPPEISDEEYYGYRPRPSGQEREEAEREQTFVLWHTGEWRKQFPERRLADCYELYADILEAFHDAGRAALRASGKEGA